MRRRIAVIGGGISGLAAAHRLREEDPTVEVLLYEAGPRLGGVLETTRRDGFLIEAAADNFLTTPPAAVDLCRRLGLEDTLIGTDPMRRQALVVHQGRLRPIPAGFLVMAPSRAWPILSSPVLSLRGKLRMGLEYLIPRKTDDEDESLAAFVCRRFGREMFERLVQPLVGGIYTADPWQLSVNATMPRFRQMEREHGSLIRATLRNRHKQQGESSGGARYGQFAALRGGMSLLVDRLAHSLPEGTVRLNSPVQDVIPLDHDRWLLTIDGDNPRSREVDGVIVATPAHRATQLLTDLDLALGQRLGQIPYASCAIISLGYMRDQIGHALDGFGFVVPLVEQRTILSCSFSSIKYEGRASEGTVLLRVFIGGACQEGLLQLPREQLIQLAQQEVADLLQIRGEPIMRQVTRQHRAMPQYHVGHLDRVKQINTRLERFPTLALAGNALLGVGMPGCIQSGEGAADRVLAHLGIGSDVPQTAAVH